MTWGYYSAYQMYQAKKGGEETHCNKYEENPKVTIGLIESEMIWSSEGKKHIKQMRVFLQPTVWFKTHLLPTQGEVCSHSWLKELSKLFIKIFIWGEQLGEEEAKHSLICISCNTVLYAPFFNLFIFANNFLVFFFIVIYNDQSQCAVMVWMLN